MIHCNIYNTKYLVAKVRTDRQKRFACSKQKIVAHQLEIGKIGITPEFNSNDLEIAKTIFYCIKSEKYEANNVWHCW